ncbi:nucleotide sugar dehydrogenase [Aeromicrobium fastidiosum]|uniref:nucleotide sugar dehydrogenase n=1 Tax=Aeromicrobium fastidiosum TaxID=52699 RepID=UPI00202380A3|nr:nucleotide sugar dehydrogenase [Aeromicrobium fastidiosum]MCL8253082.1 nucleotide sugar dehydrogenase [Aeromicrobium fastidiosum]
MTTADAGRDRLLVVGLGHVGLTLAVRAAEVGLQVLGVDSDMTKIELVMAGCSDVEDVSDEQVEACLRNGSLAVRLVDRSSGVLPRFDVAVMAAPSPLNDGAPDLSHIVAAARVVGASLERGGLVILESTSFPGTTERVVAGVIEEESGFRPGTDYDLGCSPERLDPGNRVHTFETTPKIVSGTDARALARVTAFYDRLVDRTVAVSSPSVAEFTKVFENVFSQVNIALVNEMAMVAHELGVDIWEVVAAAETKPHGFLKHLPGPGVGGDCIPVDPVYLSWLVRAELGTPLRLSELAQEINDGMPSYVVGRAADLLGGTLAGARVLVLGVTYKAGTADLRKSPAIVVVERLRAAGAVVSVSDPHAHGWTMTPLLTPEQAYEVLGDVDLVILVTDHPEFDYGRIATEARSVLDCRHAMVPSETVASL